MSRFVEKTLHSLNSALNSTGLFPAVQNKNLDNPLGNFDFYSFTNKLKNVGLKQEEEEFVTACLSSMEKRLSEHDVTNVEIDNMVKVAMTCKTMGYDVSFIYVHCLKLAQIGNLQEKHTGYLAAAAFLHPHHELVILLINTMQKDLCSSNHAEVQLALTSVCNLINIETVHNIFHMVEDKLTHYKPSIRKLAVLAVSHCLELIDSQSSYQMAFPKLEKTLADSELEVVCVAIPTVYKVIKKLPGDYTYLIDSLIHLQEQILLRRIPQDMIYSKSDLPAPWLQIDILKLLSLLSNTAECSQKVTPILKKTMQQGLSQNSVIAYAVLYQVIKMVAGSEAYETLNELVLPTVSVFLKSKNLNLKLSGLEALVLIMKRIKPSISAAQQLIIMECLTFPDETLQMKTLELMYQLANPSNVEAICRKMMEFLEVTDDEERKKDLAIKILQLAEKFIDRRDWYISVMYSVLIEAGHVLTSCHAYNIISILKKDEALQNTARKACFDLCKKEQKLSSCLVKVLTSILSTPQEFEDILSFLLKQADEDCSALILFTVIEVVLKTKQISPKFISTVRNLVVKYESAKEILNQLLEITTCFSDLQQFDPKEELDPSLTFLDNYVLQALENDSPCYRPSSFRLPYVSSDISSSDFKGDHLSATVSEFSGARNSESSSVHKSPTYNAFSSPSISFQSLSGEADSPLPPKSKVVWTKDGRKNEKACESNSLKEEDETSTTAKIPSIDQNLRELFAGIS